MANPIKYTSATQSNSIKAGNFAIGVNKGGYGPTNITNFYNGKTPNVGGYTVYVSNGSGSPSIFIAGNDAALITLSNQLGGSGITTIATALNFFNASSTMLCTNMDYPNIVTSGLVLNLDAGYTPSYPRTGTTWTDISGSGYTSTLVNGVSYGSNTLSFDGSDDAVTLPLSITLDGGNNWSVCMWVSAGVFSSLGYGTLLSNNSGGPVSNAFGMINGRISYDYYTSTWNQQLGNTTLTAGPWYFLTWVNSSPGKMLMYVNGVVDCALFNGNSGQSNPVNSIGRNWTTTFNGKILGVSIYKGKSLTPAEILQNYYAGLQRFIPTSGLVLWLDAQNPNRRISNPTIAYDVSGNVNNGNLANAISLSTNGGTSFSFDGIDDYISIPYNTAMDPTTGITLEFWINPSDISTTDYMEIFRKNISPGLQLFSFQLNGTILSFGNDTAINGYSELDIPINSTDYVNQWVHVVASYSSGLKSVYRNGILIGSTTWVTGNLLQGATDYFIGSLQGYSEFFKGLMASIKVYNRKLTSTEILSSYNATKTRYFLPAEGLSLFLDSNNTTILNGAYQNVSNDASGNNYNGDMTNGVGISNDAETSFSFDGIDDYITIPTLPSSTFSGNFTIDFWIKDGGSSATGWNWYMKSGVPGYSYTGIFIAKQGSILRMSIGTWFTDVIDYTYWNIQVGVWTKITITRNSNYVYSYCNGVQSGGSIYNDVAVGVGGFVLGQGPEYTGTSFIGKISQFSLYKRSLTPTEILQTYELQKARYINYFTNGDFSLGNTNFTGYGATMNSTVTLSGMSYSLQMPQVQYGTFTSDDLVQIDISKSYQYTVYTRTLTKGGPGNDILSGGHTGFSCYDSSQRFIDLRNCGGQANTTLTRALNAGDTYAYVSNVNSTQWYPVNDLYYFRHFMVYPPTHPEFGNKWEYTRIGFGDFNIYYSEITDIGGGELRIKFCDADNVPITFPNIGYPTPIGTGIMNGQAGSTYNYAFYPTTGDYGSWTKYISTIKGTARDAFPATTFRYATKYIKFLHLINYAIPSGTTPLPIMLIGGVKLKQIS